MQGPICRSPSDPETSHVIGMPESLSALCAFTVPHFAKIPQIPKISDNVSGVSYKKYFCKCYFLQKSIF